MVGWIIYGIGLIITLPILAAIMTRFPGTGHSNGNIEDWDTFDYVMFGIMLVLGVLLWPAVWILALAVLVGWGSFRVGVRIRNTVERKYGL